MESPILVVVALKVLPLLSKAEKVVKSAVAAKGESMRKMMKREMGSFMTLWCVVFYFVLRVF